MNEELSDRQVLEEEIVSLRAKLDEALTLVDERTKSLSAERDLNADVYHQLNVERRRCAQLQEYYEAAQEQACILLRSIIASEGAKRCKSLP